MPATDNVLRAATDRLLSAVASANAAPTNTDLREQVQQLRLQLNQLSASVNAEIAELIPALARSSTALPETATTMFDAPALAAAMGYIQLLPVAATASSYAPSGPPPSAAAVLALMTGTGPLPAGSTVQGLETAPGYAAPTGAYTGASGFQYIDAAGQRRVVSGEWFQASLPRAAYLTSYTLFARGPLWALHAPRDWLLLGSHDAQEWHEIERKTGATSAGVRTALQGAVAAYEHFRLVVTRVSPGAASCALGALRFEGVVPLPL